MRELLTRDAIASDSRDIARLYQISSDGVADYIWSKLAEPGESPLEVGSRRYQRTSTEFSFENCTIVEENSETIAMLQAFPMIVDEDYVETDPVLKPYSELELDDSYYVSGVAVFESFRGRGIGARLMDLAEQHCAQLGLDSISLIVFEQNTGAKRLYDRLGYTESDRRQVVAHPLIHHTGDAILMSKSIVPVTDTVWVGR